MTRKTGFHQFARCLMKLQINVGLLSLVKFTMDATAGKIQCITFFVIIFKGGIRTPMSSRDCYSTSIFAGEAQPGGGHPNIVETILAPKCAN